MYCYWLNLHRMGRRFRLCHKEKTYQTTSLVMSIPRTNISLRGHHVEPVCSSDGIPVVSQSMDTDVNTGTSLVASLPLGLHTAGPAKCLNTLQLTTVNAATSLVVSLPLGLHTSGPAKCLDTLQSTTVNAATSLVVSLPLQLYTAGAVESLDSLHNRIVKAGLLICASGIYVCYFVVGIQFLWLVFYAL